jgi:hypothetical protein
MLPHAAPGCPFTKLLLFAMRRMAAGGIDDAFAANALIAGFGINFRRPLVLLRALMAEVSRASSRKLLVAPCCCPRMTDDEARLIAIVAGANALPTGAAVMLGDLLGVRAGLGVLTSAQAVSSAFADLGMPLAPFED